MHRQWAFTTVVLATAFAVCAPARGEILVAPTRLVLEQADRHGEFVLVNKGEATRRYRVSLVERRMSPEGRVVPAESPEPGERTASGMLRHAPRTVVLPPDDPQTIRILVRRPGDLPRGEYRSHLLIQQIPDAPPADLPENRVGRGLSIQIAAIYGVTVPIIVRQGQLRARGALSDLALGLEDGAPHLRLRIRRQGDRSFYGDLEVRHEAPGVAPRVVGAASGIAVYTPNASRPFAMPLEFPDGRIPSTGRLVVEYRDAEAGASSLIAEAAVELAGD